MSLLLTAEKDPTFHFLHMLTKIFSFSFDFLTSSSISWKEVIVLTPTKTINMDKQNQHTTMKRKRDETFGSIIKRFDECKRSAEGSIIGMKDTLSSIPQDSASYDVLQAQIDASEAVVSLKGGGTIFRKHCIS